MDVVAPMSLPPSIVADGRDDAVMPRTKRAIKEMLGRLKCIVDLIRSDSGGKSLNCETLSLYTSSK